MLFNRNLLYTGITRARNCVTILGSSETVRNMIENVSENRRYTGLEQRIREICCLPEMIHRRRKTKREPEIAERDQKTISKIKETGLQLLFPGRCPVCDGIVRPFGRKICPECLPKLKPVTAPWCMRCGKKLAEEREYCGDCMHREHKYDRARTLYEYRDVAPSIYRFKYSGRQEYGDFFGEEMARLLGDFIGRVRPDVIVPVPLYRGKLRKRGYNQAACLARALGRSLELPVDEKLVKRVRNTAPMKHLNPTERQNNLKKAFIIGRNDVKLYDRIILVDDIYTTGTTLDEIAALLKEHGVSKVYCVTLACGSGV